MEFHILRQRYELSEMYFKELIPETLYCAIEILMK